MNWLAQMWRGEMPLMRAFWLHGVVTYPALGTAMMLLAQDVLSLGLDALVHVIYVTLATVGIVRSANRYTGPRYWAVAAQLASVLFALFNMGNVVIVMLAFFAVILNPPFIK